MPAWVSLPVSATKTKCLADGQLGLLCLQNLCQCLASLGLPFHLKCTGFQLPGAAGMSPIPLPDDHQLIVSGEVVAAHVRKVRENFCHQLQLCIAVSEAQQAAEVEGEQGGSVANPAVAAAMAAAASPVHASKRALDVTAVAAAPGRPRRSSKAPARFLDGLSDDEE